MTALQKRLDELLKQKQLLEEEIIHLQELLLSEKKEFSKEEKIELFKSLFVGRLDIYAKKWISKDLSQERFFPVTQTYRGEDYLPLSNEAIESHLRGNEQLATYPIVQSSWCKFLVLKIIQEDNYKVQMSLNKYKLNGYFEVTSSNDYKVWLFFSSLVEAKFAKALGEMILHNAHVTGEIFPNQEFSNASNLGTYVELPLFLKHRQNNKTVFVDIIYNHIIA
ncbi:MAG: helicase, partial [Arcobacteraceae bacterium]